MFNHILALIDDTSGTGFAFPHASAIALATNARVTLLRLLEGPAGARSHCADPLEWQITKTQAAMQLRDTMQYLEQHHIPVGKELVECPQACHILEFARQNSVNLIIMPKLGDNLCDLSHQLLAHTHLPTLVVRGQRGAVEDWTPALYRKILVPLDGSRRAEHVLVLAATLAQAFDAELVLAHVVCKPEMLRYTPLAQADSELVNRVIERNHREATKYLKQIESRLVLAKKVRSHILTDEHVARGLHRLIDQEQIDLVVLSAHGYSGDPQWPYGSITGHIIAYSPKPVLVVQDLPTTFSRDEAQTAVRSLYLQQGSNV
jgi:nucleotide-binding universal stress UspA family protein